MKMWRSPITPSVLSDYSFTTVFFGFAKRPKNQPKLQLIVLYKQYVIVVWVFLSNSSGAHDGTMKIDNEVPY